MSAIASGGPGWVRPGEWLRKPVVATVAVGVFVAVVAFLRLSPVARATIWAEDGAVFIARAAEPALLTRWIFTPYDGYTHALPQLIGIVAWNFVPISFIAIAVTAACCAVVGAVAAGVFSLTARWGLNIPGRLFLAAITVLVPDLTFEVLGNLANLHWFLLWLTPFVLLTRPRTWGGAVGLGVLVFAIATSEIQSFVFAPLLLWHLRDRLRWPMVAGMLAAGVLQGMAVLGGSRDRGSRPSLSSIIDGYFLQVPLTGFAGTGQGASALVAHSGWLIAYAAAVPFAICGLWYAGRSRRRAAVVALFVGASGVLWIAGFAINYDDSWNYAHMDPGALAAGIAQLRYAVVPTMFLFALIGLAVGGDRAPRHRLSPAASGALIVAACTLIASFHVANGASRPGGPTWAHGIQAARVTCQDPAITRAEVPIAPAPWTVGLSCDLLARR